MTMSSSTPSPPVTHFAWIVNQALTPLDLSDPALVRRRANEERNIAEVAALTDHLVVVPWQAAP
jgi:hypothetical protein